jgi:hypothetical protein
MWAFAVLAGPERQSPRPLLVAGFVLMHMVGRVGFEPTTNWLKANCSTN